MPDVTAVTAVEPGPSSAGLLQGKGFQLSEDKIQEAKPWHKHGSAEAIVLS